MFSCLFCSVAVLFLTCCVKLVLFVFSFFKVDVSKCATFVLEKFSTKRNEPVSCFLSAHEILALFRTRQRFLTFTLDC